MRHRRCISAILMSFVLFLQPAYAVPSEENQPENSQENNTENEKRQQEQISAPSAILMEAATGQIIYEKNPDEKLPPASVTKVMTLLLIFDALDSGQIKLGDEVTTSEYAASMGGSQVFLEPGETQTVDTLIKCISVASANDACADGHLTTARDIALMSKELITTYPQIFDYCNIWMENITHKTQKGESEFGLTNTNKLIRQYEYATGLKTGSTSKAKFCVSATGRKGDIDLIAVIMAADDSKARVRDAITLLNYGFGKCQKYTEKEQKKISPVEVRGGREKQVKVRQQGAFTYVDTTGADLTKIENKTRKDKNVKAPLKKGEKVGETMYYLNGKRIGSIDIITTEEIEKQNYRSALENVLEEYVL